MTLRNLCLIGLVCQSITAQAAPENTSLTNELGTRVLGEPEAAVGLFIAPWHEEAASNTDRPPRLFDVPYAPVDAGVFRSAVEVQRSLEVFRRATLY